MEYYSAIKKSKILSFVATWNIMLHETSQIAKYKYCIRPPIYGI